MFKSFMFLSSFLVFAMSAAHAAPQSTRIEIDTMMCGPDPHLIKAALLAVQGVATVDLSLETKTAVVSFDNAQTDIDKLMAAIATTGHASLPALSNP